MLRKSQWILHQNSAKKIHQNIQHLIFNLDCFLIDLIIIEPLVAYLYVYIGY